MALSIGLTGDVMLGRKVDEYRRQRSQESVWSDVLPRLRNLDGLFVNLECVLSTRGERWTETYRPFHFRADPAWAVPALRAAGVDYASLANNHMLDFRDVALLDTIDHLDEAGIPHAGAGIDEGAALEPAFVHVGDLDVGILALTDNTPEYAAGPGRSGVARIDVDHSTAERELLRATLDRAREHDPDLLVASLHWGPNMVAVPDETYRTLGRWLVEQGVDVVHGHSAHVFQGVECHAGGVICYDCGDFVDDYAIDQELRNDRSFLFELVVDDSGNLERLDLHPTVIEGYAVHEARPEIAAWSRERMRRRSEPFGTDEAYERVGEGLRLAL